MSNKLSAKMCEERFTQRQLAQKMNISISAFSNKMTGKSDWKCQEAAQLCEILNIPKSRWTEFFT